MRQLQILLLFGSCPFTPDFVFNLKEGGDLFGGELLPLLGQEHHGVPSFVRLHPDKALRNVGARPGDALVLTKPLGTGVLTTAAKADLLEPEQYDRLVHSMARLNAHAAEAVSKCQEIHACTDVTGFGLLGHADEMARGSGVTIRLYSRRLPLLPGALEFAEMGIIPAGAYRNLDYVKPRLTVAESVQQARVDLISDPQTSGGLLVALPMEDAGALLAALRERDPDSAIIGAVVAQTEHTLEIV